ncbi:MAG: guanylate kinase [Eubacteriales bacterium]|nr:guanylate kinase [Eubacteriales bacterium]
MKDKGLLLVVSGFSGAGKGTVVKRLLELHNDYALSISATTRKPRPGEEDGREYFFKTKEEFQRMIDNSELLEYASYVDNYYGTPKAYVEKQLEEGNNVILEIEIQGALNIKSIFPEAVLIFIMPPNASELEKRLRGRGTEDESTILARLSRANEEAEGIERYDYIVINDKVDDCVETINNIVLSEKKKALKNIELINSIRDELKAYSKGEK